MKKIIAMLLVLVIAISMFSGCANKNNNDNELKTVNLWSGYCMIAEDELEMEKPEWILTKLVDKYNEMQDDIRVEFSYFDDDDVMLQTLKASVAEGKDIPDIVVVQSGVYLEDLKDIFIDFVKQLKTVRAHYPKNVLYVERSGTFDSSEYITKDTFECYAANIEVSITPDKRVFPCIFCIDDMYQIGYLENEKIMISNPLKNSLPNMPGCMACNIYNILG